MENLKTVKEKVLDREFQKHAERKTMLELQIALQKKLDPEEISAKKPLRFAANGTPISWQEIKRKEHIDILEKELDDVNLILETIKELN